MYEEDLVKSKVPAKYNKTMILKNVFDSDLFNIKEPLTTRNKYIACPNKKRGIQYRFDSDIFNFSTNQTNQKNSKSIIRRNPNTESNHEINDKPKVAKKRIVPLFLSNQSNNIL